MMLRHVTYLGALALVLALASQAQACILCEVGGKPLSQEIAGYPVVVCGPIVNGQLAPNGVNGTCTLRIDKVFRDTNGMLKGRKTITINRFVQPNPAVSNLVFFQFFDGQLDVDHSREVSPTRFVKYMEDAPPALPGDEAALQKRLQYYFQFLMDEDKVIAKDAYNEWANTKDREVLLVAPTLDANLLRTWLHSPKTPAHCLSLFGYLMGACGTEEDAEALKRMILNPDPRMANALDGLLAGYIHKRPEDGWKLAEHMLSDRSRKWTQRLTLLRMVMFFYYAKAAEVRPQVMSCLRIMVEQPDTMDIAVERLRSWKLWDHTGLILQKYGTENSLIGRRQIIRYAISCPLPQAKAFLQTVDPDEVKKIQAAVDLEAPPVNTHGK